MCLCPQGRINEMTTFQSNRVYLLKYKKKKDGFLRLFIFGTISDDEFGFTL